MSRRGVMILLASPSGAGKSSLARALMEREPGIVPSVSVTTRGPRPSERQGIHYDFVDEEAFERVRAEGGLLESARVHGNLYGTRRAPVERNLAAGRDVIFDIDWQGTRALCGQMRADIVSVFILPPSARELEARLTGRAEDSEETIRRRLSNAREEIAKWEEFDHVLVNADFSETLETLAGIVADARLRRPAHRRIPEGVASIIQDLDDGLSEMVQAHAPLAMGA
jgi:guanylate kinase